MKSEIDFKRCLEEMKRNHAKIKQRKKETLIKPAWIDKDTLLKTYTELPQLLKSGEIHYACIVQANDILFRATPRCDCPAGIVFTTGEYYDGNPYELEEIAQKLYSYKNSDDAPDSIKRVTDSITDEYERLYNIALPCEYTRNEPVYYTTIMVFRRHLPGRKLTGSIFPVITNPAVFQSSIILPKEYWTKAFIRFYKN